MFSDNDLIRIYYALKADTKCREDSEYRDQHWGEIQRNREIMRMIEETGLISEAKR